MTTVPALTYERVFVILRLDTASSGERAPESAIALVKAVWSEAAAEAEVMRLNVGNRERASVYCWKATRLEQRAARAGTP